MAYLYFDESIRDQGEFIVGALIISDTEVSNEIREQWIAFGLDPDANEYKSSSIKNGDEISLRQRDYVGYMVTRSKLALTILPLNDRRQLGNNLAELIFQLIKTGLLEESEHSAYVDENIKISQAYQARLQEAGVKLFLNSNSATIAGIQLSDHASHILGSMLLEELGIIKKQVKAGENSGYHPDELFELGFELWANVRYALLGKQTYIEGFSPPPDDPANPYFKIEGYGLHIAPTCPEPLAQSARKRFGINYLGCIH
ncbi:hypothetical protein [Vreelandella alkaliphila]|uniref:hypothetical protein n=1 Tax=Vreelandella alkaliphila TaxID=272774 RepID=UPI003FD72C08